MKRGQKVLVVDHRNSQGRLIRLIKNTHLLTYTGTVCQAELVPEEIKRTGVDILFINPNMLQAKTIRFMRSIKVRFRHLKLVIFTSKNDHLLSELIEIELAGYLLKTEEEETLLRALTRIANNQLYYSQDILEKMISYTRKIRAEYRLSKLTQRERQILLLVGKKLCNDQIAKRLNLALQTIRTHLNCAYNKLGIQSRQEAIEYAAQLTKNLQL